MARVRTRAAQQRLFSSEQLASPVQRRRRPNAGRPPKGPRSSERHERRPRLLASQPVHVVIRVKDDLPSLRQRLCYLAIQLATVVAAREGLFRIVHASIQRTHIHLIVEAADRMALARGMQGFQISAAKQLNRALKRKGGVFADRYHETILGSPAQVRHTLAYVMNNWRRHGEDKAKLVRRMPIDPFSTAAAFDGWKSAVEVDWPATYRPLVTWAPRCWLLTTGWRRRGLISPFEVPKGKPQRAPNRR